MTLPQGKKTNTPAPAYLCGVKYQVGDKVLILHSNEEGEVVDIINNKMVMVDVRGVRFPAYMDQIDFPYFKRFTAKKIVPAAPSKKYIDQLPKEKKANAPRQVADGVWLSFLPVMDTDEFGDDVVEQLKIHLINRTEQEYRFDYKLQFFGQPDFHLQNTVHPFQDFYLHDIPFSDMSDSPAFAFDFSLPVPDKKKESHYETVLKLKPKQLFAKIEELKKNNQATFSYKLFDQYPDKTITDEIGIGKLAAKGYKVYNAKEARQHLPPARSVVDLHIEKLTDEWEQLDNYAILDMQLKEFEKYFDLAIAHRQPSLIVIHGVGRGVLRNELHDILRTRSQVKSFVNQYDPRFGYGATEIFFQY